jgi:hypothetical protein
LDYKDGKETKYKYKEEFMTDEEISEINDYIGKLNDVKGDMNDLYDEWADIEKYYQNEQEDKSDMPNTKINVMNANIEGQAAMITEQDIAIMTKGESVDDEDFAEDARIGLEWTLRKNYFKNVSRAYIRRLLKYGVGVYSLYFDEEALNKFGLVKIFPVPTNRIFIDTKIKDFLRLQEAEYIAEAITMSKTQFEDIYGEDKASVVSYGSTDSVVDDVFEIDDDTDDDSANVIKLWTRHKGKLRLREFSGCGVLLYDSHKSGDRKTNQKDNKYTHKPYYKYVDNKYPYFMTVLYPREGNLWGYGDGKLLLPLQKLLNELYDKIRICARPNLIMFDINADAELDDFDENALTPRPFDGQASPDPVRTYPWGVINEAWWRLLMNIHEEIQRITRFSGLMMGQQRSSDTATEAAIQQQQGNMATDDKKQMIQTTLTQMMEYILALMMEFYTEGKSFRVNQEENEYKWIDFRKMSNVPVKIPASQDFVNSYMESNPLSDIPKWELLTDSKGSPIGKNVDLDIDVSIGAGLPKNKAFITKFIQDLAVVQLPDEMGQVRPAVFWKEFRDFMKKYIGLPLKDVDEIMNNMMPMQQGIPGQMPMAQGIPGQPVMSADAQGLGANGGVQQSQTSDMASRVGGILG